MKKAFIYITTITVLFMHIKCTERESELERRDSAPVFTVRAGLSQDTAFKASVNDSLRMSDTPFELKYRLVDEEPHLSNMDIEYRFENGTGEFKIDELKGVLEYYPAGLGMHEVVIQVMDIHGQSDNVEMSLFVYDNLPPVPHLTFKLLENNNYQLNASQSYDPDGNIVNYHYDYNVKTVDWHEPIIEAYYKHIEDNGGVTLVLTDDKGAKSEPVFFELQQ